MRIFSLIFLLVTAAHSFSNPHYITTIHPFKEILQSVVGKRGSIRQLLPSGASPHTYELRPSDLREAGSSTALFFGAPNLDGWASQFPSIKKIELLNLVPATLQLPLYLGHITGKGSVIGIDPHFWTDPLVVKAMLPELTDTLCAIDPEGCSIYKKNAASFSSELDSLYEELRELMKPVRGKTVILTHPFFQYFLKEFGIKMVGTLEPSPGKEPTPKALIHLIELAKKENVKAILTMPQHSDRPAELLSESTQIPIFELDPLGGAKDRRTYRQIIMYNARILREALK